MILPIILVYLLLTAMVVLKPIYWGYIICLLVLVFTLYNKNIKILTPTLPVLVDMYGCPTSSLQLRAKLLPILKNSLTLIYNFMKLPQGRTVFITNPPKTYFDRLLPVLIPRDIKVVGNKYRSIVPSVKAEEVEKERECSFVSYNLEEAIELSRKLNLSLTPIVFDTLETTEIGTIKGYILRIIVGKMNCNRRQIKTFFYKHIRYCRNNKKLSVVTRLGHVKKALQAIFKKKVK